MKLGQIIPSVELKRENGKIFKTSEKQPGQPFLFIFYASDCPYSRSYSDRFRKLFERYREEQLRIYLVSIVPDEITREDLVKKEIKIGGADSRNFLMDEEWSAVNAFSIASVPQAYLFGANQRLVYKGAIDDDWKNHDMVTRVYLEDALESTLDNVEVDFPEIDSVGTPVSQFVKGRSQ